MDYSSVLKLSILSCLVSIFIIIGLLIMVIFIEFVS